MRNVPLWLLLAIPARLCAQGSYLSYSTYLGGDGEDIVHAVATDLAGNVYLAGETTSSNFPVTPGAFQTKRGNSPGTVFGFESHYLPNAFVAKMSQAGQIIWATYLGGSVADAALGIAVDANGSAYVLGYSTSPDFPTTPGAYQTGGSPTNRVFVAKFTPDGSSLAYSTFLSGFMLEAGYVPGEIIELPVSPSAIAVDAKGNVVLGGFSNSSSLAATPGAYSSSGSAFVAKLDASGAKLTFVTYLGGSGSSDIVHGIALDSAGNIYAAGTTSAADFPVTAPFAHTGVGAFGNSGAFLVKLDAAGAHAAYSAVLGGTTPTRSAETAVTVATAVAVDSNGSAYVAGVTNAVNFPTANAAQPQFAGDTDGFLVKVDPTGSQLVYSTYLGGSAAEQIYGLAVDSALRAYVVGETVSVDFPLTFNQAQHFPATAAALSLRFAGAPCLISSASPFGNPTFPVDCGDGFVTQYDREGNLGYSTYLSGSNTDSVNAVATSGTNVWLAGATRSSDFPTAGVTAANRAPAECFYAASPSSSQSYPCADGFIANLAFGAPPPTPTLQVFNFGSLINQPVAPAEVVTIFNDAIGPGAVTPPQVGSDGKLTTALGGWQVRFDGVAAPLFFAAPGQITAIVPNEVSGATRTTIAVAPEGVLAPALLATVAVNATAPAIITQDSAGIGQALAINVDGTVNSSANPAKAGSVVSLFVTGLGATQDGDGAIATSPRPGTAVQVVAGNPYQNATVLYAGPSPGTISAVTQINVELPAGVAGDRVPIYCLAGELSSQSGVTIAVK
jgi:uncharacterized protein (TIGR03437 family)